MNPKYNWAKTASLTVCAALVLAVHDTSYRPAFVQIAMMAMVAAKAQAEQENDSTQEEEDSPVTFEIEDSLVLIEEQKERDLDI
ncbi:MAG: hypothetical protein AAFQ63_19615 [Cyanobacteria bacterium J06621_11]